MQTKRVALVTGANQGIGLQIAKDLAARELLVLVAARDIDKGTAAAKTIGGNARAILLDVTNAASIAAAVARVHDELGRLDVLVNNAGIASAPSGEAPTLEAVAARGAPATAKLDDVRTVFETNVFGVIAVTQAFLPLLRAAPAGRIVNVSSRIGSLTTIADPGYPMPGVGGIAYGPSKTALNAVTLAFAQALASTRVKVNAVCPGFTSTSLNGFAGTRSVEEAAREPVRLALLDTDGPTGTFSNESGVIPW